MNDRHASQLPLGFVYHFELLSPDGDLIDSWTQRNLVPTEGLDYASAAMFGDVAPIGTWYVGLFSNNYVPVAGTKASDIPTSVQEFTGYSEAARPVWQRVTSAGVSTNNANRAAFTLTAPARLYGGFLVSTSTKGGGTGTLLSIARFDSPHDVQAGATLRVRAELSLIPTNVV